MPRLVSESLSSRTTHHLRMLGHAQFSARQLLFVRRSQWSCHRRHSSRVHPRGQKGRCMGEVPVRCVLHLRVHAEYIVAACHVCLHRACRSRPQQG